MCVGIPEYKKILWGRRGTFRENDSKELKQDAKCGHSDESRVKEKTGPK